ncbi:MAG: 4Fe-4S dicluster domain-containing protein [Deltaproteobacteria bacterium]|nr:4Fe-4S dicluster domain-containing protein [Deltaproteobacteria bacterium]
MGEDHPVRAGATLEADGIKARIRGFGADLVGIADLDPFGEERTIPPDLLDPYTRAVSIAVRVPLAVFGTVTDRPGPHYASVYMTVNRLLDEIALKTSSLLQDHGYWALPVPASQILDRTSWRGALSHKAVARIAGLGWQGKSLLLVTPEFGPRVRLVTVLTDAPIPADRPIRNRCGGCASCREACPAGAVKGVPTASRYQGRNEALDFDRCREKLTEEFAAMPDVGVPICGVCIKVCPFGITPRKRTTGEPPLKGEAGGSR